MDAGVGDLVDGGVMSYSVALLVLGRLAMPSALVGVGGRAVLALHHVGHAPGALKAGGSEVGGDEDRLAIFVPVMMIQVIIDKATSWDPSSRGSLWKTECT